MYIYLIIFFFINLSFPPLHASTKNAIENCPTIEELIDHHKSSGLNLHKVKKREKALRLEGDGICDDVSTSIVLLISTKEELNQTKTNIYHLRNLVLDFEEQIKQAEIDTNKDLKKKELSILNDRIDLLKKSLSTMIGIIDSERNRETKLKIVYATLISQIKDVFPLSSPEKLHPHNRKKYER